MLKKANFRWLKYRLNITLPRHNRQTWNGYFLVINENVSSFFSRNEKITLCKWSLKVVKYAFVLSAKI